jgi:ribosomal protein S27AE
MKANQSGSKDSNDLMLIGTITILEFIKWVLFAICLIGGLSDGNPILLLSVVVIPISLTISQGILRLLSHIEKHLRDIKNQPGSNFKLIQPDRIGVDQKARALFDQKQKGYVRHTCPRCSYTVGVISHDGKYWTCDKCDHKTKLTN